MRSFRSILFACAAGLAACLGMVGLASATEMLVKHQFRVAVGESYHAESAKLKAELAHMHGQSVERMQTSAGLTRESNGFRLAAIASASSEVAKGTIGISATA